MIFGLNDIIAIDPGSKLSGVVVYNTDTSKIVFSEKLENKYIFDLEIRKSTVLIEIIDYVSSKVGLEIINTAIKSGEFINFFKKGPSLLLKIGRACLKKELQCRNDSEIRKLIVSKYGKTFCKPLVADCMQAFALIHYHLN